MFKFLLNLLVQISKVLPNSKIHVNSKIKSVFESSFESGPVGPGLAHRTTFFLGRHLPPPAK
jgi:hypothetical protein